MAGKRAKCPNCGASLAIPLETSTVVQTDPRAGAGAGAAAADHPPVELHPAAKVTPPAEKTAVASPSPAISNEEHPASGATGWFRSAIARPVVFLMPFVQFYWTRREALWQRFLESLNGDRDEREVRLAEAQFSARAFRDKSGWRIDMPECCVACGKPTPGETQMEERTLDDLTWPLWAPLVGCGLALLLLCWSVWLPPLILLGGFTVGYLGRKQVRLRMTSRRCPDHQDLGEVPSIWFPGDALVVRFAHRDVKRLFLQHISDMQGPALLEHKRCPQCNVRLAPTDIECFNCHWPHPPKSNALATASHYSSLAGRLVVAILAIALGGALALGCGIVLIGVIYLWTTGQGHPPGWPAALLAVGTGAGVRITAAGIKVLRGGSFGEQV